MITKKLIIRWNAHHGMWDWLDEYRVFINDSHDCYATKAVFSVDDSCKDRDNKRIITVEDWNEEET